MKVFVVTTHYETPDSENATTINIINGVYSSLESAQKSMEDCFNYEKTNNFSEDLKFNECKVSQTEMFCSIYNTEMGDHYVSINITECDVED